MPYEFNLVDAKIEKVRLAGWALVLPFDFNSAGALKGGFDKLRFITHLSTPKFRAGEFPVETGVTLTNGGPITIRLAPGEDAKEGEKKLETLLLSGLTLKCTEGQQSIRSAETFWLFEGQGGGTDVTFRPDEQQFADWGKNHHNFFGWSGVLEENTKPVIRLAHAQIGWNGNEITAAQFIAPAGVDAPRSLFNLVKAHCALFFDGKPRDGSPVQELVFADGRRKGRTADFFGEENPGPTQVAKANGAIWIAQGSFLRVHPRDWITISRDIHAGSFDGSLSRFMHSPQLGHVTELNESIITPPEESLDHVFEGLSLWNLGHRKEEQVAPVLL